MDTIIEELSSNFALFDNPMDKYVLLIDMGKNVDGLPKELKTKENLILGCASQAWVICEQFTNGTYRIRIDSDSFIVRGLLSILEILILGKESTDIQKLDYKYIFEKIGLGQSITSQRMNGFMSALDKIKKEVRTLDKIR